MSKTLDLFGDARAARDAALEQVTGNAGVWFDIALRYVAYLPKGWRGTGEDLRLYLIPAIGAPHSPNAWGALVAQAMQKGMLLRTGERRAMRTMKSHARRTDVYEKL